MRLNYTCPMYNIYAYLTYLSKDMFVGSQCRWCRHQVVLSDTCRSSEISCSLVPPLLNQHRPNLKATEYTKPWFYSTLYSKLKINDFVRRAGYISIVTNDVLYTVRDKPIYRHLLWKSMAINHEPILSPYRWIKQSIIMPVFNYTHAFTETTRQNNISVKILKHNIINPAFAD